MSSWFSRKEEDKMDAEDNCHFSTMQSVSWPLFIYRLPVFLLSFHVQGRYSRLQGQGKGVVSTSEY
eukprot:4753040-Pyramimonas_sp.AAC.1